MLRPLRLPAPRMSGPRVWVDENDLRVLLRMAVQSRGADESVSEEMMAVIGRVAWQLEPPPPPPLPPYRACMQGHGA